MKLAASAVCVLASVFKIQIIGKGHPGKNSLGICSWCVLLGCCEDSVPCLARNKNYQIKVFILTFPDYEHVKSNQ